VLLSWFLLTRSVFDWAVAKWGQRWDVRGIADPGGLPLLILILTTFSVLTTPVSNTMIRMQEREADAFGLDAAREPDGFAQSALKLGSYRKLNPGPIEENYFLRSSKRAGPGSGWRWTGKVRSCRAAGVK